MNLRPLWRYAAMALAGAIGVVVMLAALHLWQDHSVFHELVQIEMARQRAIQSAPAKDR